MDDSEFFATIDRPPMGCTGRITSFSETDDGRFLITLTGSSRFRIREELPLLIAIVEMAALNQQRDGPGARH